MYVSLNERRKSSWAVDHMRYGCVYVYDYAVSAWEGRERESEEEWNKKQTMPSAKCLTPYETYT